MHGQSNALRCLKVVYDIQYAIQKYVFPSSLVLYECLELTFVCTVKIAILGQILDFSSFLASDSSWAANCNII
jgi:uracil DNA glycosylase